MTEHEAGNKEAGDGEQGEDGDPLGWGEEPGSGAAKIATAEEEGGEEGGEQNRDELAVDVLDVEIEDGFAAGLKGWRVGGEAVVLEHGEVKGDKEEGSGEGEGGGAVETAARDGVGEVSGCEGDPGEEAEDVAEEHASGGGDEEGESEGTAASGVAGPLLGEESERGEGEEERVGAGVGGKLAGEAREEEGGGAEAEERTGAAADEEEEEEHRGGEGEDFGKAAGKGADAEDGETGAAEEVAEWRVEIDGAEIGEELA